MLVRVRRVYLHKVIAVDAARQRARMGNNRGGVNGWAGFDRIHGICVAAGGQLRPRLAGKVVNPEPVTLRC
ncbi:MAG: hypothetical protein ABIV94_08695 [Acidimicrobiales bacterium]